MEPVGSLSHSQVPASCTYLEPVHTPTLHFLKIHHNLSTLLRLSLPSGLFPSGFTTKTLYTPFLSPIRATCPAHPILLDFITRTILGEQYRSLSSSLCSFLHSHREHSAIYRVSQEECARLRESVPYVELYRYNPKHLYPKLNGYGDNGQ